MRKATWTAGSIVLGLLLVWMLWPTERPTVPDVSPPVVSPPVERGLQPPRSTPQPPRSPADATPRSSALDGPRRDLRQDEVRGGHTIERHVGLTDAQLRARLARESIAAASTFFDLDSAERAVGHALDAHADRVAAWEQRVGARPNLVVSQALSPRAPVGRVWRRGAEQSVDAFAVLVVLRWRAGGSFVLTAYPEERARGR